MGVIGVDRGLATSLRAERQLVKLAKPITANQKVAVPAYALA